MIKIIEYIDFIISGVIISVKYNYCKPIINNINNNKSYI